MRTLGIALFASLLSTVFLVAAAFPASDVLYENQSDGSPILPMIQSARHTIDIEIYTMKDQGVIEAIKDAITERHVRVRVIQTPEPVSDPCPIFGADTDRTTADCKNLRSLVDFVKQNGGQYVPFSYSLCGNGSGNVDALSDEKDVDDTKPKTCFQHGKVVIVDANSGEETQAAMLSTGNFDPTSLCDVSESPDTCNRDFTVKTTDSVIINTLENVFEKDLASEPYDLQPLLDATHVDGQDRLTASPHSLKPIVDFINSAKVSLQIENQYLEDPTMNAAITAASNRGVKVYVMVASATSFGKLSDTSDHAKIQHWTDTFQAFDQAGVNSKIFDSEMKVGPKPGYLHAKVILVDGQHAWVGSVNGSTESLSVNREFGIFSDDPTFVRHLSSILYSDFNDPNSETWQQSLDCAKDACGGEHATRPTPDSPTSPKPTRPHAPHKPKPPRN